MEFHGSQSALQELLQGLDVQCHWEHKGAFEVAVIDDGVSNLKLNWWPQTGVLQLVGDPEQRGPLMERLSQALAPDAPRP